MIPKIAYVALKSLRPRSLHEIRDGFLDGTKLISRSVGTGSGNSALIWTKFNENPMICKQAIVTDTHKDASHQSHNKTARSRSVRSQYSLLCSINCLFLYAVHRFIARHLSLFQAR
jgi:hypothetical protein